MKTSPFSYVKGTRGAALIEIAIALPILFLLLYGATEIGRRIIAENQVDTATEAGVSVGIVNWGQPGFASMARDLSLIHI